MDNLKNIRKMINNDKKRVLFRLADRYFDNESKDFNSLLDIQPVGTWLIHEGRENNLLTISVHAKEDNIVHFQCGFIDGEWKNLSSIQTDNNGKKSKLNASDAFPQLMQLLYHQGYYLQSLILPNSEQACDSSEYSSYFITSKMLNAVNPVEQLVHIKQFIELIIHAIRHKKNPKNITLHELELLNANFSESMLKKEFISWLKKNNLGQDLYCPINGEFMTDPYRINSQFVLDSSSLYDEKKRIKIVRCPITLEEITQSSSVFYYKILLRQCLIEFRKLIKIFQDNYIVKSNSIVKTIDRSMIDNSNIIFSPSLRKSDEDHRWKNIEENGLDKNTM